MMKGGGRLSSGGSNVAKFLVQAGWYLAYSCAIPTCGGIPEGGARLASPEAQVSKE
jgi:hypothetical protein